jgi:tetratricopeptide (TPR) repeat protein
MQGFKAYAKAEKLFRKALSIDSEHHYSNTGLGDMYTHLGQYEKAGFYYRKGLHNGLQYCSREVIEVIEKLEKLVYLYLHKCNNKNKAKLYQLKLHRLQNCTKK